MPGWYRAEEGGAVVLVRVRPHAKTSAVGGLEATADGGRALGVRLAAKPVDGAANKALMALMARELGVAKSAVQLVAGRNSRTKRLQIAGDWADLEPRLSGLAGE